MDKALAKAIEKLRVVSAATVATALFKRGLRQQVIQGVHPVQKDHPEQYARTPRNMVGPAFTLRYMPAREDRNQITEFLNPHHPQRQAIEQCPEGYVLVMDSRKEARAASAGDIILGDADCVIVIPADIATDIADEATEMTAYEDFVAEKVREGVSIIGLYPCTQDDYRQAFAAWRKAHNR